ncbi:hypothetical protein AKJ09_03193 [Labilithrix luteola]|uniref:Uncharacterized protein n=1 Tax=Labilithrix luteola TaxID=1391654 RepID=A0A0K1PTR9_9BACT|nr:hypothetical protein AKJ09_03193 [Labilithrix luteola]
MTPNRGIRPNHGKCTAGGGAGDGHQLGNVLGFRKGDGVDFGSPTDLAAHRPTPSVRQIPSRRVTLVDPSWRTASLRRVLT